MNEMNKMEEKNQKEVNLIELVVIFYNWIKKITLRVLNFFGYFARLIYRRKILFLVVVLVCVGVGQYLARPSARVYKAEATALIQGSDAQTVRQVFRQLENSLATNDKISLATKLSIPDSVAKSIEELQSFYVIDYMRDSVADKIDFMDSHSLTDTMNVRMRDRVYIRLKTKSINQVPQVEKAILNYLNNNQLIKSQYQAKKSELEQQVRLCDAELQRVDSLADTYYFNQENTQLRLSNNQVLLGEQRKQLFYGDLMRILEMKSGAQLELAKFTNPIEIPSSLVVIPAPLNGRFKYGIVSLLIGLVLGLGIAGFFESFKTIISYLRKK